MRNLGPGRLLKTAENFNLSRFILKEFTVSIIFPSIKNPHAKA